MPAVKTLLCAAKTYFAKLFARPPRRTPGTLRGLVAVDERFFEPLPEKELAAWNGE
jgi:hypothetical protein